MKAEKNNTFCKHPFEALATKNYSGNKLRAAWPCCMMGNRTAGPKHVENKLGISNVSTLTPEQIFKHSRMDKLRQNAMSNIKDPACAVCWEQEAKGITSFRLASSNDMSMDDCYNPQLKVLDVTVSSLCNLRCRMCGPQQSNSLYIDHKYFKENNLIEMYNTASKNWNTEPRPASPTESLQWQWMLDNTDKIKVLRMSGGEPFYDKKTIQLLDRFIKTGTAKDTRLEFMTNGTLIDDELMIKLNQFKAQAHNFSIDGWGSSYDYIRYPSTFASIDSKLKNYIQKTKNLDQLHVAIVVSALNILAIKEFTNWIRSIDPKVNIHFSELYPFNRGTSLNRLSVNLLEYALDSLEEFGKDDSQVNNVRAMIQHAIKDNKEDKSMMLGEIVPFDKSRNQNFYNFLHPKLVEWLKQ
jgi:sulfatase maturation enzyme AslB (radical SAM superfamily)